MTVNVLFGYLRGRAVRRLGLVVVAALAASMILAVPKAHAQVDPCGSGGNPVACENSKPGTPSSTWDVPPGSGGTIQGFSDPFSVNLGGAINFKIQSAATSYTIDIYRMGYYGGDGARYITSLTPNISVSHNQPSCNTNTATGLVDCSNWGVSASWTVPADLLSGVYIAHLARTDGNGDESVIPFVVRDDSSHSDILFKTDDATWQAYNDWGGYSLYTGNATDTLDRPTNLAAGRAEQVSYDRPFATRADTPYGQDYFFYAEFPMIEFLEENGYDVSYIDQATVASPGGATLIERHKILTAAGHDEYWSSSEMANVTAARDAGVNMAFFTGNEAYWKTRWTADVSGEDYRTLVSYKESSDSAQTDPDDPTTWTGAWFDPRFSPPADGGKPQNALTGQLWTVNMGTGAITVPSNYAALRLWRNTSVATLQPGQTATLSNETLGYEWDQDIDNGFRPAGEFDLSSTTMDAPQVITDYQADITDQTVTHNLTEYRASSGALVFGAGTVQWAWGLNSKHDGDAQPDPSPIMQQATVNLVADMGGVQPLTLMSGLVQPTESTDTVAPVSQITSPVPGAAIQNGSAVTVSGTATDSGGGVVAGVEISADGGATWHPVTSMSAAAASVTWSYTWEATGAGNVQLETRATDDSGNIESPGDGVTVTVGCPCSLYSQDYVPTMTSINDSTPLELGVRFTAQVNGWISGIRFYKGPATPELTQARSGPAAELDSQREPLPARPPPAGRRSSSTIPCRSLRTRYMSPLTMRRMATTLSTASSSIPESMAARTCGHWTRRRWPRSRPMTCRLRMAYLTGVARASRRPRTTAPVTGLTSFSAIHDLRVRRLLCSAPTLRTARVVSRSHPRSPSPLTSRLNLAARLFL